MTIPFHTDSTTVRARNLLITGLHASLLFTSALSSFMTQLSRPPSPTLSRTTSKLSEPASSPRSAILKSSQKSATSYKAGTSPRGNYAEAISGSLDHSKDIRSNRPSNQLRSDGVMRHSHSPTEGLDEKDAVFFRRDSPNSVAPELLDSQDQSSDLLFFESDHEGSALSSSSESFLSRPPNEPSRFQRHQQESSHEPIDGDRAAPRSSRIQSFGHSESLATNEDLAQSKLFSPEEAKSIYASAMSSDRFNNAVPGGWDSYEFDQDSPDSTTDVFHDVFNSSAGQPATSSSQTHTRAYDASRASFLEKTTGSSLPEDDDSPPESLLVSKRSDDFLSTSFTAGRSVHNTDPQTRPLDQNSLTNSTRAESRMKSHATVKTIFIVDNIKIQLPPAAPAAVVSMPQSEAPGNSRDIPGAFSVHQSIDQSMTSIAQESNDQDHATSMADTSKGASRIAVQVSQVVCCFDMALVRLLLIIVDRIPAMIPQGSTQPTERVSPDMPEFYFSIHLQQSILRFESSLKSLKRNSPDARLAFISDAFSTMSGDLFRVVVTDLIANLDQSQRRLLTEIFLTKVRVGFPNEDVISFNQDSRIRESVRDVLAPVGQDISVKRIQTLSSNTQFEINTASLHVNVNINRLAEVINWLGGLSTMLDLKNSMKSTLTVTEARNIPAKPTARAVRFDVDSASSMTDQPSSSSKLNLRIGGIAIDLVGSNASLRVDGSALKVVVRDGAVRTQIDRVNLYAPLTDDETANAPLFATINTLQVAYFDLPKENDLTKLVTLLSPSKDRDEQDEDILLDTLLRQRRKGGLLRINVAKTKLRLSKLQEFHHFKVLAEEASQLSSVAKYLPEDDRPGLLVMTKLEDLDIELSLNRKIGSLAFNIKNTEFAMVTLPSLLLLSIGHVHASHGGLELIGTATPHIQQFSSKQALSAENMPKLSIRFIAGEMEPTVRVKLYNIRVEYHVATMMSLLGLKETASGEVIVAEMANSVANLAAHQPRLEQSFMFQQTSATKPQKPLRIEIGIRDVIIGLNPKDKPAKGLLVLSRCRFNATYSDDQTINSHASFEVTKAHFMAIDNKEKVFAPESIAVSNVLPRLASKPSQLQSLEAIGYVSVSQTSGAKVNITLTESSEGNLLNLEVRDNFLVLETCADSTQTLLSLVTGLAPPQPPHKGTKYRTEVIPVKDMLASFSGHGFTTAADSEYDDDDTASLDDETGTIILDDKDDISVDLDQSNEFALETDGIEEQSVASFGIGSVLFRQPATSNHSTRFGHSSLQSEAYTTSSISLENNRLRQHGKSRVREWNSYTGRYHAASLDKISQSPLQVSFIDMHFIWNLYDGYDWQSTRDAISGKVDDIKTRAEERRRDKLRTLDDDENEAVIEDMLFNSIYIGISAKDDPLEWKDKINGVPNDNSSESGSYITTTTTSGNSTRRNEPKRKKKRLSFGRSKHHRMTFELKGVSGHVVSFPPDSGETQSSIDIKIRDLEVFDNMPSSTWRKFATYMYDAGSRQKDASMVHIEMLTVRPDPELLASEFILKVNILPLRLHVDQDALDFLTRFFEFRDDSATENTLSVADVPFIQRAEVGAVQIKLDFKPKTVDWRALRSGKTTEFMNFIILDGADMILRQIILHGVRGFDKLGHTLNDIWTPDVKANQLSGVLAGLAPVRPLVNVGLGVRDLVMVPMREYQKDGRLVRAVRKGVVTFGKTTTTELAKLGAKLAIGTHTVLSNAEGLLLPEARRQSSHENEVDGSEAEERPMVSPYANPPIGVVQGLRGAYRGLERDLLLAKDAIVAMPGEVMESGNASSAAAAILRNAPVVILRPAMGVTNAIGQTLLGATNSLDKTEKRRTEDVSRPFCKSNPTNMARNINIDDLYGIRKKL